MPPDATPHLNELATVAPGASALMSLGSGHLLYLGHLRQFTPHALGASVLLAAIDGVFRLRTSGTGWTECRGAFIPAGTVHEMDFGEGRFAGIVVEPQVGITASLRSRLRACRDHGGVYGRQFVGRQHHARHCRVPMRSF